MEFLSICAGLIGVIMGVAYPIIIEGANKLDSTYNSDLITEIFNGNKFKKIFIYSLYASLFVLFIALTQRPPLFGLDSYFIINSGVILTGIATLTLIVSYFILVYRYIIFTQPKKLIKFLIGEHYLNPSYKEFIYFKALIDILRVAIANSNKQQCEDIINFAFEEFQKYKKGEPNKVVEYPAPYYDLIYFATESIVQSNNKNLATVINYTVGGGIIVRDLDEHMLSEETYLINWLCLRIAIDAKRDDLVLVYWQNAHQSFLYDFIRFEHTPDLSEEQVVALRKEVEQKKARFLEFHYALGSLLLYQKRYKCLTQIFNYTQSIPPQYILLPNSLNDVITTFVDFHDPYDMNFAFISHKYPFPDFGGLNGDYQIKHEVSKYIALLLLRQYTMTRYLSGMDPFNFTNFPKEQSVRKKYVESLTYFSKLVEEKYNDFKLLEKMNLDFLTTNWLEKAQKPQPRELIQNIIDKIKNDIDYEESNQTISPSKLSEFNDATNNILTALLNSLSAITNSVEITNEYKKWYINGVTQIMTKEAFVDNQATSYLNYHTILAEIESRKVSDGISMTFHFNKTKTYLIHAKDIVSSLSKLNIDDGRHIIINFGVNENPALFSIEKIEKEFNIQIISIKEYNHLVVGSSFFILNKDDLPTFIFHPPLKNDLEIMQLKLINERFQIFTSILDLNIDGQIPYEYMRGSDINADYSKSVFAAIAIALEIRWKENIELVCIKIYNQYRDQGDPDNLSAIIPVRSK